MEYDYSKLTGKIVEVYGKKGAFATAMKLSERSMSLKLNNQRFFKAPEISKAVTLLGLSLTDIPEYFFTPKV